MATNIIQPDALASALVRPGAQLIGRAAGAVANDAPVRFSTDDFGGPRPRIKSGATNYYPPFGCAPATSSGAITANTIYAFIVLDDCPITALATEVTTLLAGNGVAGIYSPDDDPVSSTYRMPKTLRSTSATVDTSTATVKAFTLTDTVYRGDWIAMNFSSAVTLRQMSASITFLTPVFGTTSLSVSAGRTYLTASYTYDGTLPSSFPTLTLNSSGTVPAFFMRA